MGNLRKVLLLTMLCLLPVLMLPAAASAGSLGEPITVYVSISDDGEFVTGVDGTVMAHVPVEIGYFDLAEYGLSDYYRYEADSFQNGGAYISSRIMKQPTLLHLYIKVLEKYFAGRDLTEADMHSDIINVTGSATHLYMQRFWGHDENLMYFVDHAYPLQAKGWGATCDYILLYDGSDVDLGMFTDWNFHLTGAFAYFEQTTASVKTGEKLDLTLLSTATRAGDDGESEFMNKAIAGEPIRISEDFGRTWKSNKAVTDDQGKVALCFDHSGTYWISAGPSFVNYRSTSGLPDVTPPISVVTVTPSGEETAVREVLIDPASLNAPARHKALDKEASAAGLGVEPEVRVTWSGNRHEDYGTALEDTVYTADLHIRPAPGYRFTEETIMKMGSRVLRASLAEDGSLEGFVPFPSTGKLQVSPQVTGPVANPPAPAKVTLTKAKKGKKKATITWKRVAKNATGYQIQFVSKKTGDVAKTVEVKQSNKAKIKVVVKQLKKGKYIVKVRACNTVKGKTSYGTWSNARKVKVR